MLPVTLSVVLVFTFHMASKIPPHEAFLSRHGQSVTFRYDGWQAVGKISVESETRVYLCQNVVPHRDDAREMFGYKHAICLYTYAGTSLVDFEKYNPTGVAITDISFLLIDPEKSFLEKRRRSTPSVTPLQKSSFLSLLPTNLMGNLVQSFRSLLQKEPIKTFVALGITTDAGVLTEEGEELFLQWIFEKHQEEFYEQVAKKLLAEKKKQQTCS